MATRPVERRLRDAEPLAERIVTWCVNTLAIATVSAVLILLALGASC